MLEERLIRVTYDAETGEHQKFTFNEFVTRVADHTLIEDCTFIYLNADHPSDTHLHRHLQKLAMLATGLRCIARPISFDELRAKGLPLSKTHILRFMDGRPIWHLPTMFAKPGRGIDYHGETRRTLHEAVAITAVLSRAAINGLLEGNYRAQRRRRRQGDPDRPKALADAIFEHALNVDIGATRRNGQRTARTIIGITRYTLNSAKTTARTAINRGKRGRSSAYTGCLARVEQEVDNPLLAFGQQIDAIALAAWYHRVVSSLRLAAAALDIIDASRNKVGAELRELYWEWRKHSGSAAARGRFTTKMRRQVQSHKARIDTSLRILEGRRECKRARAADYISPQIATIVAFYAGVDLRSVFPDLCADLGKSFDAVLASAAWLGRLNRDCKRELTGEVGRAMIEAVGEQKRRSQKRRILSSCMQIGLEYLDDRSRTDLLAACRHTAQSGEPRTVTLGYRELAPAPRNRVERIDPEENAGQPLYFLHPELATFVSEYRPLNLNGTFLSLPPNYRGEWAEQWEPFRDRGVFRGLRKRAGAVRE